MPNGSDCNFFSQRMNISLLHFPLYNIIFAKNTIS